MQIIPTCIEPAIEFVLKSPITSLFKYVFRSKKLEFDDDESIDANNEFTRVQLNEMLVPMKMANHRCTVQTPQSVIYNPNAMWMFCCQSC